MVSATQLHVLVVDDVPIIADVLCKLFQDSGCSADAAYSGEEALQLAASRPPDILVSDLTMPGIDGLDLALRVKEGVPECGVLLYSVEVTPGEFLKLAERCEHFFEYLSQPASPIAVLQHVERLFIQNSARSRPRYSRGLTLESSCAEA